MIQRKDLPRIYTMCLPPSFHAVSPSQTSYSTETVKGGDVHSDSLGLGIIDLEAAREEVVAEVRTSTMLSCTIFYMQFYHMILPLCVGIQCTQEAYR